MTLFFLRAGALAAALLLPPVLPLLAQTPAPAARPSAAPADARFEKLAKDFIEQYLRWFPVEATQLGDHRFDGQVTDYTPGARAGRVGACHATLDQLALLDPDALSPENRVDHAILRLQVESIIFNETELRDWARDPLAYNAGLTEGIYLLVARDFAPAATRLASLEQRLAAIPDVVAQARENLRRPAQVHTETAIRQAAGAVGLVRGDLIAPLLEGATPEVKARVAAAQDKAAKALEGYREWLQTVLLPRSDGDFRIGAELFRKKLRFSLDSDLSLEQVLARAEADLRATQTAMAATARPLHRQLFPEVPEDKVAAMDARTVSRAVLAKLGEDHPNNDTIVEEAGRTVAETTAFVRERNLVRVPAEPLRVIVIPEFKRGVAAAYCDSPGPLEKGGETFYGIEPTPPDWTPARVETYFREYNRHMLQELTIHEAMPGHFLQGAHANEFRAPTLVRAIFQSGTFVEGWACYAEQAMAEAGYGGPEVKMQQLKMRLRLIINAIIDQKIHAGTMTEREALDLMMNDGFQEEGEAVGKWKRARLTSAQLSTYFVGTTEMLDLRDAARAKLKDNFNAREYHDAVLAHGSPPPRHLRALLGW